MYIYMQIIKSLQIYVQIIKTLHLYIHMQIIKTLLGMLEMFYLHVYILCGMQFYNIILSCNNIY